MHFFPSRRISVYMAKLFVTRSLAVLAMLVLILMTLDLLGESGKILSVPGNNQGDVLSYIGMRAPQIIARFLPFSVLLGTLTFHLCVPALLLRLHPLHLALGPVRIGLSVACS